MSTRQFAGRKWMVLIVFAWAVNSMNSQAQQSAAALRITQTEAQQSAPDGVSPNSANTPRSEWSVTVPLFTLIPNPRSLLLECGSAVVGLVADDLAPSVTADYIGLAGQSRN